MHYHYEDLIGKSFKYGARGPDEFDCWGLAQEMLRRQGIHPEQYGFSTERAAIQIMLLNAAERPFWTQCDMQQGAVLLFRIGRFVSHVGFALNGTQFIHTWERSGGVVVESLSQDWQKRLVGCYQYAQDK